MMKEIFENDAQENPSPETNKKKKSPLYKWTMFANLMTIPALAFYFYVGLNGKINGYFILLILMILSEFLFIHRNFNNFKD